MNVKEHLTNIYSKLNDDAILTLTPSNYYDDRGKLYNIITGVKNYTDNGYNCAFSVKIVIKGLTPEEFESAKTTWARLLSFGQCVVGDYPGPYIDMNLRAIGNNSRHVEGSESIKVSMCGLNSDGTLIIDSNLSGYDVYLYGSIEIGYDPNLHHEWML